MGWRFFMGKIYVETIAKFTIDGKIIPLAIIWEDGRRFEIDRVIDVRRAVSLKAGGQGMRYTVRILGKERYLFFDDTAWFVES